MVRRHGWRIILLLTLLEVVGIGIRMRRRLISRLMDFRSLALLLLKGRFWLVLLVSRLLRWWCRWNTRKAIVYDVLMTNEKCPCSKDYALLAGASTDIEVLDELCVLIT